jgi:hypothetical protein
MTGTEKRLSMRFPQRKEKAEKQLKQLKNRKGENKYV